jgi:hypothetical protein
MEGALAGFTETTFTHDGLSRAVYSGGSGPAVIVIHEVPGRIRESSNSPDGSSTRASASACRRCSARPDAR